MTKEEVRQLMIDLEDDWHNVGLRFEEKAYKVGDIIADSKANVDRYDERDFPEFGEDGYDEMPELPGVSTYNRFATAVDEFENNLAYSSHAYIVVSNGLSWYDNVDDIVLDEDELVIEDGQVAVVLK